MSRDRDILDMTAAILSKLHEHLKTCDRFPHAGQAKLLRAFFNERKKIIQGQCGRSFGKTEAVLYLAWRYALTNPGTETYIICPEIKQGKKIYWLPRRLQAYGPQEFVAEVRESELRVVFKNGAHIMLDGCENYEALRGIKPNFVVYDEFQHHNHLFDEEVMQPNLSSGRVSLVVMGTPPRRQCYYIDFRKNLLEAIQAGNSKYYYVELPSEMNPTLDKEWLNEKRLSLIRMGKANVWLREYMGQLAFDTEHAIFPYFDKTRHVRPRSELIEEIAKDKHKLEWIDLYDPGTSTCFAGLFVAYNPYTAKAYILDEIYATEKNQMTARAVWATATEKKKALYNRLDEWRSIYDEAAAWFANELPGAGLSPTHKERAVKTHEEGRAGESKLHSLMMGDGFTVAAECEKFLWEMENYVTDDAGKYPTTHDHLMDLLMYFVQNVHIDLDGRDEPPAEEELRAETFGRLFAEARRKEDLLYGVEPSYFDEDVEDIWQ